jgi:hypothetical protein
MRREHDDESGDARHDGAGQRNGSHRDTRRIVSISVGLLTGKLASRWNAHPGIYCTIELHIPRKTPSCKVSADAIIFNEAGVQVAVVENGVVHLRKVGVVPDLGQAVEVNSGVKRGDQVILNPAVDLADGSKVRTRLQPAQTS